MPSNSRPKANTARPMARAFCPAQAKQSSSPASSTRPRTSSSRKASSCAVMVVPMLQPKITGTACRRVSRPTLTKPSTITVTAELLCSTAVTTAPASTPRTGLPVTAASRLFRRLPAAVSRLWLSASMPYKNSAKPPKSVKILVRFCSTAAVPPAETFLILFMQLPGGSGFLPFSPFCELF